MQDTWCFHAAHEGKTVCCAFVSSVSIDNHCLVAATAEYQPDRLSTLHLVQQHGNAFYNAQVETPGCSHLEQVGCCCLIITSWQPCTAEDQVRGSRT
jgi:hypothetical protein